ncbi:hypothetical protein QCA50_007203 [Cerrena zonata]|uniref:Uncharacterized protein n=1 Tax=Cerrena zonata TaxID=2478898 RepID=A0AAW0G9E4_9APHY
MVSIHWDLSTFPSSTFLNRFTMSSGFDGLSSVCKPRAHERMVSSMTLTEEATLPLPSSSTPISNTLMAPPTTSLSLLSSSSFSGLPEQTSASLDPTLSPPDPITSTTTTLATSTTISTTTSTTISTSTKTKTTVRTSVTVSTSSTTALLTLTSSSTPTSSVPINSGVLGQEGPIPTAVGAMSTPKNSKLSHGQLAGIIVGIVSTLILAVLALSLLKKRIVKRRNTPSGEFKESGWGDRLVSSGSPGQSFGGGIDRYDIERAGNRTPSSYEDAISGIVDVLDSEHIVPDLPRTITRKPPPADSPVENEELKEPDRGHLRESAQLSDAGVGIAS